GVFVVLAVRSLSRVNRYEVAKIVDDQMGLKDRMTSALYFERLGLTGGLADAAVDDASAVAARLDTGRLALGTWPRHTLPVAVLALLTVVVALGPVNIADWFTREKTTTLVEETASEVNRPDAAPGVSVAEAPKNLPPAQRRETLEQMKKLESEVPPERDPDSRDLDMNPDLEDDIEAIKAAINLQDMKELQESFQDDEKKGSAEEREERPPKIAPLDKELLDDIVRSKKEKVKKGEGSKEDAIGVAVKMPAPPGARQKGPSTKGRGGHGGGDVGESGDTRGPPRRVDIAGRDPLIIESRRSPDVIEKTDLEKVVMNELMMRLSMDEFPEIAAPTSVPASFTEQKREPVVEETVPLGLRGYVQRYFEGLGAE
ncbi:MAG TPA: hypothetical protein VMY39_10495, partial [Planctomycetota bacterium]|nr:hypothetical protein [Planctomycetota bacterium]